MTISRLRILLKQGAKAEARLLKPGETIEYRDIICNDTFYEPIPECSVGRPLVKGETILRIEFANERPKRNITHHRL